MDFTYFGKSSSYLALKGLLTKIKVFMIYYYSIIIIINDLNLPAKYISGKFINHYPVMGTSRSAFDSHYVSISMLHSLYENRL